MSKTFAKMVDPKTGKAIKSIPEGYFAFVKDGEVRLAKRNTKGRPKGRKNKRQGCEGTPKQKRAASSRSTKRGAKKGAR